MVSDYKDGPLKGHFAEKMDARSPGEYNPIVYSVLPPVPVLIWVRKCHISHLDCTEVEGSMNRRQDLGGRTVSSSLYTGLSE